MIKTPLIGAHVSASGGLSKAIENAERIGAECIQIFGASPRQWAAKMPSAREVERFRRALKASSVKAVFLHAAYLVNLASSDEALQKKSVENLSMHLEIAERIGANGLIFHLGSGKNQSLEESLRLTVEGMHHVLEKVTGEAQLIMENSSGGGGKLGAFFSEIGQLLRRCKTARVAVCIDTAHAFEAGIIDEYSPAKIVRLFDEFDREVGLEHLVALHINDSKTTTGSKNDRHENLGEGYIGLSGFKHLAREKRLWHGAWILEVPGFQNTGPDKKNVDILRSCFQ